MREKILQATYDSPLTGHQGFTKTYQTIRECFAWKGLQEDVLRHIRECDTCQRDEGEQTHPAGLLQSLPILKENGKAYRWISSPGFLQYKGRIAYMWWWIA